MKSTTAGRPVSLAALLAALSAGILFYSQQATIDWDEGFHLVAASLIQAGRRPYVDFCFPQPPLHAYWNALWLHVFGGGWRWPHVIAALLACGAMILTAEFVYRRANRPEFAASVAALFVGMNSIVVEFATKAQAYGAGLFLTVAAFRLSVGSPGLVRTVLAGCVAGAAADCTMLTAPGCVVLLLWTLWQRRFAQAVGFVAGVMVGLLPVLISWVRLPYLTWFNLVGYHVFFRHVGWMGATRNDVEVLASWVDSGQALVLGVFAVAGLVAIRKPEFFLAGAMAVGLGAEAAIAHPTFPQYFIFTVPFLAMLAAVGFSEFLRARWAIAALTVVLGLSLANSLASIAKDNDTWDNMEAIARKVEQVTPAGAAVLADPPVYFVMHRPVPSGMEFPASHKLELPAAEAARLHIVPQSQLERQVASGTFATAETCKGDEDEIRALQLPKFYSEKATLGDCLVYWGFK